MQFCRVLPVYFFLCPYGTGSCKNARYSVRSGTVLELYNAVTDYTSNNSVWDKDDNRRGMLQGEALRFLMRERDVKNYSDIFS